MKTVLDEGISRRKLGDEVLDRLLRMIADGQIRAGDQLPSERELMRRYQVGRPAVREGLQALHGMGLIEIRHGERARLVGLTPRALFDLVDRSARHLIRTCPQTLENLTEARLFFEVGMVRLAVERGGKGDIVRLAEALEQLRRAAGDSKTFVEADMAFHSVIASFSGNPIFTALSEFLLSWLFEHYPNVVSAPPEAQDLTIGEHSAIYECIAARNEEGAVKAMTGHLTRTNPRYKEVNAAANQGDDPSRQPGDKR
ncbi:MAG: transcriptional regulator NanR [Acidobacteria bacterium]|nr:MAG: transcriptional regulator NanR [Acidobacteriota bacterium]